MRELLCELLRDFYERGWVSGTGGGVCALEAPGRLLVAPTAVHKERVQPADLFVLDVETGRILEAPTASYLAPSECADIFRTIVRQRRASSVIHTHALSAVLACDLAGEALSISRLEMLKGIRGVDNTEAHLLPVIDNTPHERELVADVERVLAEARFAAAYAVGVRDHGAYIWGADIWEAKKHAEVYHFLFEALRARGG